MRLIRASNSSTVVLGQVLGRGGEGIVHAVHGAPKLVAKIYLKPPDAAKIEKLKVMIRGGSPALLGVAAWPTDLVVDENGGVRGFLMPRIAARQDAHRLYSPKSRRRTFPDADFRFVVRAATNLARAFAQIHAAGHVIGDVNHGNALIGKDGTAVLIDCDSFQVSDQRRSFPCDVGSPLFTPPELQGKTYRGLQRDSSNDRFGLAVLLFHLLFQGRHPFAGRYADGEMPIERAIDESRFAYGANAATFGMSAPPATLPLTTFGAAIAELFERAFAPPGGAERPGAIEWIEPLQKLETGLGACNLRPRHFHPRGARCCWCGIEEQSGARLFDDGQTATAESDAVSAQQLWQAIEGVRPPSAQEETPQFLEKYKVKRGAKDFMIESMLEVAGGALPWVIVGGVLWIRFLHDSRLSSWVVAAAAATMLGVSAFRKGFYRARRAAQAEWNRAVSNWKTHSSANAFFRVRAQLAELHRALVTLDEQRIMEVDRVRLYQEPRQHQAFLDTFEIEKATFANISRSQIETLLNRGIRSAGDVVRFRDKLYKFVQSTSLGELRSWADQCGQQFKFDAGEAHFRGQVEAIDARFRERRQDTIDDLRRGPELLSAKRDEVQEARARAEGELRQAHEKLRRMRESA